MLLWLLVINCFHLSLVSGKVRRSTNETVEDTTQPEVTTTTQTSTTSTQPYDPYGTLDDLYRVPNDITWLPLGYDPNFDGTSTIPDTLSGLPGSRQKNKLFFEQMQTELDRLGAQISKALNEEISLSQVSPLDFRTISNAILASSSDVFLSSMTKAQQDNATQSDVAGVMGLNNLIEHRVSSDPPKHDMNNKQLFSIDPVKCAVLVWKLHDETLDQKLVTYKPLFSLPLKELRPLKPFLTGLTLTMARSFSMTRSTDAASKTALVIDSFDSNDWESHRGVCSALFLAVHSNINDQVDQWNTAEYPELKNKIVPMFACVKPSYLNRFRFNELWPMIDELAGVNFDWQRGSAIVSRIFETAQSNEFQDNFFVRMDRLNKFVTVDLTYDRRNDERFRNLLLSKQSLTAIADETNDPLLLEWLYSEVRSELYPEVLSQYSSEYDIYTLGTMVSAMTVADLRQFQPQAIYNNIGAFQSKGLEMGQAFTLVDIYLKEGKFSNENQLQSENLRSLRRLIPAVGYEFFLNMDVSTITYQIILLRDLADRSRNAFSLTSAQRHIITQQLTVNAESGVVDMIVNSLGPSLSMELPPSVYLTDLQSIEELGITVDEDGGVTLNSRAQTLLSRQWTEFQKTVFFNLYRKEIGPDVDLNERSLFQLGNIASGIPSHEIFESRFTDIIGITHDVMNNGGDMNKAWLLSLQIRRAFAAMYALESIDQFDLGLLGTANLRALDGLTLRMFSVKEMEGLNAADCQDVISKIGNLEDVYLIPFPKRQELVCFYIERCRFDYSATRRMYMASSDKSILYSYDSNSARTTKRGARYMRKVFDYCSAMTPVALTSSDFEVLGHLVCDIPASIIDQFGVPLEVLWMFHDCWFNEEQGDALFKTLTSDQNKGSLYTDTTLSQLAHSLCTIVPPQRASQMRSQRYRKEIIDFVQYSYDYAKKQQRKHGLTRKHLNQDLFWSRGISKKQQEDIVDCYIRTARNALDFFRDYEQSMFQHNVIVYDDRLNLNPNSFQIRPVYHPANEEYYDVPNVITGDDDDDDTDSNSNSDDNYLYKTDSAYDFGNDNSGGVYDFGNSRQRREYFDYYQQKITCPEVHVLHTGNRLWSLMDLEWMQTEELSRCIYYFGRNSNMTFQQRTVLKDKIGMLVGGWENIPPEYLIQMGSLALTMQESELRMLKLDNMQVNYFLGEWEWERWQREVLFENIRRRFNFYASGMEKWEFEGLGELICGMRAEDMARIYTEIYYDLAFFFGHLTTCHYKQLRMLLPKAKSTAAFGPVSGWQEAEIIAIGSPLAALSVKEFDMLTPSKNRRYYNLVAAIPAHVIPLIPVHNLRKLRTEFFQSMTIEQVIALTPVQWHSLSDSQAFAAMDIWFGFDNWPMSYLRDLQQSSANMFKPVNPMYLLLLSFVFVKINDFLL